MKTDGAYLRNRFPDLISSHFTEYRKRSQDSKADMVLGLVASVYGTCLKKIGETVEAGRNKCTIRLLTSRWDDCTVATMEIMLRTKFGVKLKTLDKSAVSYQVVLTKADKPSATELTKNIEATRATIAKRPAAHPDVIVTSSEEKTGLDVLRAEIEFLTRT